jgi:N-acetyl-anhydromuramyl-L-alanine amidase AmpD
MITNKDRLITTILGTIYPDKSDKSILRINIDNLLMLLASYGYNLPNTKFSKAVEDLLNAKLYGARITPGLKYTIATLIIELADKVHVTDEQLIKYYESYNIKEVDEQSVKNWRKEYYGSMDKHEKQSLVEAMQGKLRPDVIEEIKKA